MQERPWHRHYDSSVPAQLDYEELALPEILDRQAKRFADRPAIHFLKTTLTYAQLSADVDRLATALGALGVRSGTRVAIQLPNLPQTVIAFYAALKAGAQVVMTNPLYTPREIEHQWKDSGVELAFVTDYLFDQKLRAARGDLPAKQYIVASIPEYLGFPLNWLAPFKLKKKEPPLWAKVPNEPGVHRFRKLVKATAPNPPAVAHDLDEVAVLQYTGGTTGVSKGAMLTHRNLSFNVQQVHSWFPDMDEGNEVVLAALPLFHVFGLTVAMNWGIYCGGALALLPDPRDVKALVECVSGRRVTIFPGVPAMFNALNNYAGIESVDVSSVKSCFSGSAPIPVDVLERFEKLTGARILEGFGMSESSPVTHVNPLGGVRKVGTVGVPVPDTDAKVVDVDEGTRELAVGEEGELIIRGPQVMKGYWEKPGETAETLRDGWLHTGDLASVDEDGYFKIVGRKKDMINAGGYKIFPDEVDSVLMAHEGILEAATIGVPDPRRGETVKSFIVLQPGKDLGTDAIVEYCRERLAPYKVPREIEFLDELPKSTVLKVLRRELRDRELAKRT